MNMNEQKERKYYNYIFFLILGFSIGATIDWFYFRPFSICPSPQHLIGPPKEAEVFYSDNGFPKNPVLAVAAMVNGKKLMMCYQWDGK